MIAALRSLAARSHPRRQPRERVAAALVSALAAVAVAALATELFPYHSLNHDEGVYLQQAALLLDGRLAVQAGELADAVRPWFFVRDGGRLYPKYQPYPAALYAAAIAVAGEPRVALALVAAANAALVYVLGATAFDRRVGVLAATAFAASPMALVTTSTFLPYAPTTTLNLAFAALYLRAYRTGSVRTAALAGGATGLAFFARPYTAVLFAAPFLVHAGWQVLVALRRAGPRATLAGLRPGGADRDTDRAGAEVAGAGPTVEPVRRNLATAAVGLAFVGLVLAYNARVTGSPWLFPYEAFAPRDGPGFGHREILGHAVEYTPALAVESNAVVLRALLVRWGPGGAVGSLLALAGLLHAGRGWRERVTAWRADGGSNGDGSRADEIAASDGGRRDSSGTARGTAQALLAGLFLSVPLGNVAFWGNFNLLGGDADPTDGLIASFGPFYHFDLLAPLAIFAAAALVAGWRLGRSMRAGELDGGPVEPADGRGRGDGAVVGSIGRLLARLPTTTDRLPTLDRRRLGALVLAGVLATGLLAGAANAALLATPLERNAAHTQELAAAYEPFEAEHGDPAEWVGTPRPGPPDAEHDAVVFVPTPYGSWLNHPFQALRNDPGLDGPVVYAMDRGAAGDLEVADAYPDRDLYRYDYRGEWTPAPHDPVVPTLQRLERRSGERLVGETTVGVAGTATHAVVRLETDDGYVRTVVDEPGERVGATWSLDADGARLRRPGGNWSEPLVVEGAEEVTLQVRLVGPGGGTLTYRQAATVRVEDGRVEALWPPERTVCALVDDCGREGTYLPERPEEHRHGVAFDAELREE